MIRQKSTQQCAARSSEGHDRERSLRQDIKPYKYAYQNERQIQCHEKADTALFVHIHLLCNQQKRGRRSKMERRQKDICDIAVFDAAIPCEGIVRSVSPDSYACLDPLRLEEACIEDGHR